MFHKRQCHCKYEPKIHTTLALFLMLMGCLLFAIFGTRAIPSYIFTKDFVKTTCTVENTQIAANVCCEASVTSIDACSEGYSYPCAEVFVTYDQNGRQESALLLDGRHSLEFASRVGKCSYFHCYAADYDTHLSHVQDFLEEYGNRNEEHTCYYDPKNMDQAVLDITSSTDLLHALLWPLLLSLLSIIIFVIVIIIRKKRLDPLDEDDDDDQTTTITEDCKSVDPENTLASVSRRSSEVPILPPPEREEVPPESPEKWAKEPRSRGSSARPATRSAIHFDIYTPTEEKSKPKSKASKKNGVSNGTARQVSRESKKSQNLTPVNA